MIFKQHIPLLLQHIAFQCTILLRLTETTWDISPQTFQTNVFVLVYKLAEYCTSVVMLFMVNTIINGQR